MVCSLGTRNTGVKISVGRRGVEGWGSVLFILNLGCEVVADVANVADVVLHHQGDLNKNSHIIPRCILGLGYFGHTNK